MSASPTPRPTSITPSTPGKVPSPSLRTDQEPSMRIEIICTGDEVLTGKINNTNFGYMSQKLEDVGLSVVWGATVGDDRARLLEAFGLATTRADAVIVNGGLGPPGDEPGQEIPAPETGRRDRRHGRWPAPPR